MSNVSNAKVVWKALEEALVFAPDATAYVHRGEKISFREVNAASDRLATGLLNLGIKKGDRVAVIAPNRPEWLYTYFAAAKIGAICVGLSVRHGHGELLRLLELSQPSAIISVTGHQEMDYTVLLESWQKKRSSRVDLIFMDQPGPAGTLQWEALLATQTDTGTLEAAKAGIEPDDEILLLFTSGTTGKPKGAALTNKSQLASAYAEARHIRAHPEDVLLLTAPLFHVGGITCGVLTMLLGKGSCVLFSDLEPKEVIRQASAYRPTIFFGFPSTHTVLMMDPGFAELDRTSVRLVMTGGASAGHTLLEKLKEAFPHSAIMNIYGLTETSGSVIMSSWNSPLDTLAKTVGKPLDDFKVKVADQDGRPLARMETGEIFIKGNCVISGYYNMHEDSLHAFDQYGWLKTGDMAYVDEEGRIVLMGRRTEMYIQEGFNVYPVEVEEVLLSHPQISQAAGIGIPDPVLGEVGRYYVVPNKGSHVTEKELQKFCLQNLADFKLPQQIVFRSDLPHTATGKINKAKLRSDFEEEGK